MANLISAVATVINGFVGWLSTVTNSLIQNPLIQIMFAVSVVLFIIGFLIHNVLLFISFKYYKWYSGRRK